MLPFSVPSCHRVFMHDFYDLAGGSLHLKYFCVLLFKYENEQVNHLVATPVNARSCALSSNPEPAMGFCPHIAMALFGGAMIRDKKWAFALPIFSMFVSDVLFEVLYRNQLVDYGGFYEGQITNYILFAAITLIGFLIKKPSVGAVTLFSLQERRVIF